MKLLFTSSGLTNNAIRQSLRDMLGRPTKDLTLAVIPTASNPDTGDKSWVLDETLLQPYKMGWKHFYIVDLAAVNSLDKSVWWPQLQQADVILVGGGSVFYLSYWMQKAGLFDALPDWLKSKVYVGISAGSQVICSDLYASIEAIEQSGVFNDVDYDELNPAHQSSTKTLKIVDFTFRPHLNSENFPKIRLPYLKDVAKTLKSPMYALDDNCAIRVIDDRIDVVGGGTWQLFAPGNSPRS